LRWFNQGFDTLDLKRAKALLMEFILLRVVVGRPTGATILSNLPSDGGNTATPRIKASARDEHERRQSPLLVSDGETTHAKNLMSSAASEGP
jgi:hypothetical protein